MTLHYKSLRYTTFIESDRKNYEEKKVHVSNEVQSNGNEGDEDTVH